jgi:glutathione S-transferase
MQLYGSSTSPYVRRVRVFAADLGLPLVLTDVATEAGQVALRRVTPLWKVPTVVFPDGTVQWDSHAILAAMVRRHGWGSFRPDGDPAREANLAAAIDGALDSAINVLYLEREGVDVAAVPYLAKQRARVDAAMAWVEGQLRDDGSFVDGGPGFAELALYTTLGWMTFRGTWPVADHPALVAFEARWDALPGWRATAPA